MRSIFIARSLLLLLLLLLSPHAAALAENYPSRDIHVICAFAPGTGGDTLVRFFADRLRRYAGMPVLVENKPGATNSIATEYVARARADGYTFLINPGNGIASNVYLYKQLSYDPIRDLAPVTTLVKLPFVLAVSTTSSVQSVRDLIELVKRKGDKSSFAVPTNIARAAGALFNERARLKSVPVPYKSTMDAINDINGGFIDFMWADAPLALGLARQGKLRILAVTSQERSKLDLDIPTMRESGIDGFALDAWWGAWFPAGTPGPIVDRMAWWLNQILDEEETAKFLAASAPSEPFRGSPESLGTYLKQEIPRWAEIYKLAGVEPQ